MNILIIEDDQNLAQTLKTILRQAKYNVDIAYDGEDGLYYAKEQSYDVIILDVMLPIMNGYQVIKEMRKSNLSTPVIMLTAKSELPDKILGLDCGADDYMTKPFEPEELLARLRALSRRQSDVIMDEITFHDITLTLPTNTLSTIYKGVNLSNKEFELMKLLLLSKEVISTKESIIIKIWGSDSDAEDNNVEAYISFLRKKLKFISSSVTIKTLRKVGYVLQVNQDD